MQTFNSCTNNWLYVVASMGNMSKNKPSTSMTHVACESKLQHVCGVIHIQATGWQSGLRSCVMRELSTHLVQEVNVGTVHPVCRGHSKRTHTERL